MDNWINAHWEGTTYHVKTHTLDTLRAEPAQFSILDAGNHLKQLFRQWQHLPAKERKKLQKDLENWENLSPRQRKSIRRRFKN
jgi:hypothetical protein